VLKLKQKKKKTISVNVGGNRSLKKINVLSEGIPVALSAHTKKRKLEKKPKRRPRAEGGNEFTPMFILSPRLFVALLENALIGNEI